jgi:metal-responsive CopG/Arc/MetJ family transcriptional regulator
MIKKTACVNNYKKHPSISVRISPELYGCIERCREKKRLSRSDVVRDALRHYFATKQE